MVIIIIETYHIGLFRNRRNVKTIEARYQNTVKTIKLFVASGTINITHIVMTLNLIAMMTLDTSFYLVWFTYLKGWWLLSSE